MSLAYLLPSLMYMLRIFSLPVVSFWPQTFLVAKKVTDAYFVV